MTSEVGGGNLSFERALDFCWGEMEALRVRVFQARSQIRRVKGLGSFKIEHALK